MAQGRYQVQVEYDAEARWWYVSQTDVPGLAIGAASMDELIDRLKVVIPELIAANEADRHGTGPVEALPYDVHFSDTAEVARA
jgi:predicted RNase H-like HicB family nuclease